MKAKLAIAVFLVFGVVGLGYPYVRGNPPFTSQFVQTCEKAVKERLAVPSTYQRINVEESRRAITFDEFFTDPMRAVSEATRKAMVQVARVPPVRYVALIDYQAQDSIGAIIRERATCAFNSLNGSDAPTRTYWVMIDGEYNREWVARQPNAATLQRRLLENW
ncbi:hypothetical protein CQ14_18715 [Bradyrhizobium lablabi]|uniref:Uncharacterized protein n=1 Tax=Bradyrhizobium lablabi TaxID=722472 RepID=A0A0R3MH20_9BRAD|nr:hypothetical protein [Bradyrhizobium lablabi]KRR18926.1 hypothetical protein CQ14_18715 [Bradyrhizobium lablabi]